METTSLFLAKLLGIYFIIIGVALLTRKARFAAAVDNLKHNPALMLINAALPLIIGLLIVLSHNVWVAGWPVLITVLGWLALTQGLLRLFYPETSLRVAATLLHGAGSQVVALVLIALGIFLAYNGFGA